MKAIVREYLSSALVWPRVLVIGVFAYLGFMLFGTSNAATYSVPAETENAEVAGNAAPSTDPFASAGTAVLFGGDGQAGSTDGDPYLEPVSRGFMPYAYLPWGDIVMDEHAAATGTKQYFGAFVQGEGCTPYWDGNPAFGLDSNRGNLIKADIDKVRARGGDVTVSFGGAYGTELAKACPTAETTKAAYQKVITKYGLKQIDFAISGAVMNDQAAMLRRIMAARDLQQDDPGLMVSVTLPVGQAGLDPDRLTVLRKFRDAGVVVSNVGILAYNFGNNFEQPAASRVIAAADAAQQQLRTIYLEADPVEVARGLTLITMIGRNDTAETFTVADAAAVRDYALAKGIGTLGFWAAARDQQCGSVPNALIGNDTCSQVTQTPYQFAGLYKQAF